MKYLFYTNIISPHQLPWCCEFAKLVCQHAKEVLNKTPEMLPALKKAGVVDAGGQGWLFVLEGALYFLEKGFLMPSCQSNDI